LEPDLGCTLQRRRCLNLLDRDLGHIIDVDLVDAETLVTFISDDLLETVFALFGNLRNESFCLW
jgi:hypothetical protein